MRFVPQRNMLAVASTDSTIALYRVRDWILLRSLKGHKGRVNSFDAHPDGRVALSVGVDKMLRMWDLVAGKSVTAMRLGGGTSSSRFALLVRIPCSLSLISQRATWFAGTRTAQSLPSSAGVT